MNITNTEASQVAQTINGIFEYYAERYSFEKYPANSYEKFKLNFSSLSKENSEIHHSLTWKWGHWGKLNFPQAQKNLITEIEKLWPIFIASGKGASPKDTFEWWSARLGRNTTYITVAYITHLVHHHLPLPIIDQHNFRAMNYFISVVRPGYKAKKKPSNWNDIMQLKIFMSSVLALLPGKKFDELDRFLMMYGKKLKSGN